MFRTAIPPGDSKVKISLSDKILCTGSCFASMVGHKLEENKFKALVNPFGTVFNPLSIFDLLNFSIDQHIPPANTYVNNQGIFYNDHLHADFSHPDREQLKVRIEKTLQSAATWLSEVNWLILTFGTAIVYQRAETGKIVANCHKMPSRLFNKRLLTEEEIISAFTVLVEKIKSINPGVNVILTVSPVRHIKDGLEDNAVSKALLRITCHHLAGRFPWVSYFPAYEIMLDDLRDYRFYERDMIHPTPVAEDYIWEMFAQKYFSAEVRDFMNEWQKIRKSLNHRPFHPHSESHQNFLKKLLMQLHAISDAIDVKSEIETVTRQLNAKNQE